MIANRTRPLELRHCPKCDNDHPATLFNAAGFCVYCAQAAAQAKDTAAIAKKADKVGDDALAVRRKAHLELQLRKKAALAKVTADREAKIAHDAELDAVEAAKQELARRELAREHLLPFIMRFGAFAAQAVGSGVVAVESGHWR